MRVMNSLRGLGCETTDSQANFVWFAAPGLVGDELARRLEQSRVHGRIRAAGSATRATCAPRCATSSRPTACLAALRDALAEQAPQSSQAVGGPA